MTKAKFTFATWTPSEAAQITGVDSGLQREWRRRGLLPSVEGHARYDAFSMCEIWMLKELSERGIPLKMAAEYASLCAIGIVAHILKYIGAYEGDHLRVYEWNPELLASVSEFWNEKLAEGNPEGEINEIVSKTYEQLKEDIPGFEKMAPKEDFFSWGVKSAWLENQILKQIGTALVPASYFIWWADGDHAWEDSIEEAFAQMRIDDPRRLGAIIVLDQLALADEFFKRIRRPLVRVELEFDYDSESRRVFEPSAYVAECMSFGGQTSGVHG